MKKFGKKIKTVDIIQSLPKSSIANGWFEEEGLCHCDLVIAEGFIEVVANNQKIVPYTKKSGVPSDEVSAFNSIAGYVLYWIFNIELSLPFEEQEAFLNRQHLFWIETIKQSYVSAVSTILLPPSREIMSKIIPIGFGACCHSVSAAFHNEPEFWGDPKDIANPIGAEQWPYEGKCALSLVFHLSESTSFREKVVKALGDDPEPIIRDNIKAGLNISAI